jgi:hypothetical protein
MEQIDFRDGRHAPEFLLGLCRPMPALRGSSKEQAHL